MIMCGLQVPLWLKTIGDRLDMESNGVYAMSCQSMEAKHLSVFGQLDGSNHTPAFLVEAFRNLVYRSVYALKHQPRRWTTAMAARIRLNQVCDAFTGPEFVKWFISKLKTISSDLG